MCRSSRCHRAALRCERRRCEPWVLGHREAMPWFDARYRGYGYNKIQHLAVLGETKYNFVVLHDSYCVHR